VDPAPAAVFGGVKVIELAQWVFVPAAGGLLADWGADVIKIEPPGTGDSYRGLVSQGITTAVDGVNPSVEMINRGKRSIGLDVKSAEGRALLYRLVADADVFLTNMRPAALERMGLGVEELRKHNPSLIYARGHGMGVRGPDRDTPSYDASAFWARGGMTYVLSPDPADYPLQQRGAFGDRQGAMNLAFGIAGALYKKLRTGQPSVVDVSLLSSAIWTLTSDVLAALQGNHPAPKTSRLGMQNPLVNFFRSSDERYLMLVPLQPDRYWVELCTLVDRPDLIEDPRFADITVRAQNREACLVELDAAFAQQPYAEWVKRLSASDLPWGPVQTIEELIEDPQVIANDYLAPVESEDGPALTLPAGPVQFDESAPRLRRAPEHGAHTEQVLLDLGLDWPEISALKDKGVVL
jgi:crotonobetainyl-CoA:carnitine CoA-transferase CaiB-like acyl-CoA transferase